jgi:DNA-binding transcriptional ArsR family regulator
MKQEKQPPADLIALDALEEAAECLRTLAHPHRLRIVELLLRGRFTVGELAQACGLPSAMTSEHLRLMKDRGLLDSRREGRRTFYSIADPNLADIMACVEARFGKGAKRTGDRPKNRGSGST